MSLHTDHRTLIGTAATVFLILSIIIAVLPAFQAQKTPATIGSSELEPSAARGRVLYLKEGCGVCHTQFVRDLPVDAPYGRGSVAGDYAMEKPPLLGTQRTGPDLSNVGLRQPSEVWNLIHLYNPRAVVPTSVMPGYPWYFKETVMVSKTDVVVHIPPGFKPSSKAIVATEEAIDLVRYLQSLKQIKLEP
ncbi:MAG: cytochrome c oxidase cbb3-type subunit 2 [Planctomycetota bacterium]|jgi:cytochrome c oxidase cbb3-type subunit 2